jgi:hypothetical protein
MIQTVLELVVPSGNGEECLAIAKQYKYKEYCQCVYKHIDKHAGPFGQRTNSVIRFLPPNLTFGKFCPEDMEERKKAEWYLIIILSLVISN